MAGNLGYDMTIALNGNTFAGVRSKNPSFNREPVDISDDNSQGWRELLAIPGQRQVNIPVSGIVKDTVLREAFFAGDVLHGIEITYPDGGVLVGSFFMASYSETGEYNGAITFDAEFQSSGEVTYDGAST